MGGLLMHADRKTAQINQLNCHKLKNILFLFNIGGKLLGMKVMPLSKGKPEMGATGVLLIHHQNSQEIDPA
jgi:hypothetical protein